MEETTTREFRFAPLVSHGQFYLGDDNLDWDPSECWDDGALERNLAVMDEALGIGTVMIYGYADIVVSISPREPLLILDGADQVITCGLSVPSGRLKISTVPEGEVEPAIDLPPGPYRAAVYWRNVLAVHDHLGKTEDQDSFWSTRPDAGDFRDQYQICLWPGPAWPTKVLKQFDGPMTW